MNITVDNYDDIYGPNHWYDIDVARLGKLEVGPDGNAFFTPAENMNFTQNELLKIARLLSETNVSNKLSKP